MLPTNKTNVSGSTHNTKKLFRLSLRQTSKTFSSIMDAFFVVNKELKVPPSYSAYLSPNKFHNISHSSTNLRSLVIQSCDWLTDDLLKPVLKNNPKLEILDITDCVNCSSTTLQVGSSVLRCPCRSFSRSSLSTAPTSPGWFSGAAPGWTPPLSTISPITGIAGRRQMTLK